MIVALLDKHWRTRCWFLLDPSKMHGQAYDGASNMSGKISGTAARIQSQYPLALYIHCASHCLILAVDASFPNRSVRNMIGVVK